MVSKHIDYIDGMKGFCALCVIVLHYLLAFDVKGFYGWSSGITIAEQWGHYWEYFPLSILTNMHSPLYIFFAIIAFIPAYKFFREHNTDWLTKQTIVRYFRFVPYTFFLALVSYGIFAQGWYFNHDLAKLLQEPWDAALLLPDMSLMGAVWAGLFGAMTVGAGEYVTSLWCMHIIFIGSYLTYAILFLLGAIRYRFALYFFLWLAAFDVPLYAFFIIGIAAADLLARNITLHQLTSKILFGFGLLCVVLGEIPWQGFALTQEYGAIFHYTLRSCGVFAILFGLCQDKTLQHFFMNKVFLHCARYCFEYILVHAIILFSVSAWIFIVIHEMWGYGMAFLIACVTAIPLNVMGTIAFGTVLQPMAAWLSRNALKKYRLLRQN